MRRIVLAAALLTLTPGLGTAWGWEEPPALIPPALEPPAQSPSPSTEKAPSRPLLVIPGVTAPRPARPAAAAPPLDGPQPVRPPTAVEAARPGVTLSPTLEPVPDDDPKPKETQPDPAAEPARRPGVLGRLWGSEGREPPAAGNGITIEPHSDPAVEAAVKRRVEKQIQESLGDRVRNVEVRVKARDILIRAHASHFWHRWSARRTLDALPLPAGYRARVEMD